MSWRSARRWLALLLPLGAALNGCGFEPLYADRPGPGGSVQTEMSAVEVDPIPDRRGQILRNRLYQQMRIGGKAVPTRYRLVVGLSQSRVNYGIARDVGSSLSAFSMVSTYYLLDARNGTLLFTDRTIITVNFSTPGSPYATVVNEDDAQARGAEQIADIIANRVALYLRDPEKDRAAPLAPLPDPMPMFNQQGIFLR